MCRAAKETKREYAELKFISNTIICSHTVPFIEQDCLKHQHATVLNDHDDYNVHSSSSLILWALNSFVLKLIGNNLFARHLICVT